ncbi:MAG: hypothetical protein CVU58_09335, partial [Deltaproteobacteria bacterium HGW-Deltaproteobacteria-16]
RDRHDVLDPERLADEHLIYLAIGSFHGRTISVSAPSGSRSDIARSERGERIAASQQTRAQTGRSLGVPQNAAMMPLVEPRAGRLDRNRGE